LICSEVDHEKNLKKKEKNICKIYSPPGWQHLKHARQAKNCGLTFMTVDGLKVYWMQGTVI